MKSKAPLSLMEQLVMLLVFALAAALCLQVFVFSAQVSRRCEARDRAVTIVQNAAEAVKSTRGDLRRCETLMGGTAGEDGWQIWYDADWKEAAEAEAAYQLLLTPEDSGYPELGTGQIRLRTVSGDVLFSVTVSWQEVTGD